jgi:hypothetical protein
MQLVISSSRDMIKSDRSDTALSADKLKFAFQEKQLSDNSSLCAIPSSNVYYVD